MAAPVVEETRLTCHHCGCTVVNRDYDEIDDDEKVKINSPCGCRARVRRVNES